MGKSAEIKCGKRQLYDLVASRVGQRLPPIGRTEFVKAYRAPDYWLKWEGRKDGQYYEAFLAACAGAPLLRLSVKRTEESKERSFCHKLTVEELEERKMLKWSETK